MKGALCMTSLELYTCRQKPKQVKSEFEPRSVGTSSESEETKWSEQLSLFTLTLFL
jgi:hypothetical protein